MPDDVFFGATPGMGIDDFTPMTSGDVQISPTAAVQGSRNSLGTNWGFGSKVAAVAGGAVPDLIDTVSSSLGFTDRGQINEALLTHIGSPGLRSFYEGNRGAIEVGSGIAAIIGSNYAAGRFLRPAGLAMRLLSRVPYANRVAQLDRQYNTALRIAQASNVNMARSGAIGVEQYVGESTFARLGQGPLTLTAAEGRSIFTRKAVLRGFAQNVSTEAVLAATSNQNSFLFSDSLSENILWMAGGLGVGGLIDRMMATHVLKRVADGDIMNRESARAYDQHGTEAARVKSSTRSFGGNVADMPVGITYGNFTDLATSYKLSADEGRNVDVIPGGHRNPLAGRRNRLSTQQDEEVRNTLNKATTKGIPGVQGSSFGMQAEGFGNHVDYLMHHDAAAMYGVEEIGAIGEGMTMHGVHADRMGQLTNGMERIRQILKNGGTYEARTRVNPKTGNKEQVKVLRPLTKEFEQTLRDQYRQLNWRSRFQPMAAVDGEWVPREIGEMFDGYVEPEIISEVSDDLRVWSVGGRRAGEQIGIGSDLELHL